MTKMTYTIQRWHSFLGSFILLSYCSCSRFIMAESHFRLVQSHVNCFLTNDNLPKLEPLWKFENIFLNIFRRKFWFFKKLSHKNAIIMVDQAKKVKKMSQNVAIYRLFLRNFLAILAINLSRIGYFWLSTVGNTEYTYSN